MRADQVVDRSQQVGCRHRSVEYEIGPMREGATCDRRRSEVITQASSAADQETPVPTAD